MPRRILTDRGLLVVVAAGLYLVSITSVSGRTPTLCSPFPMFVVVPSVLVSELLLGRESAALLKFGAPLLTPLSFLLWSRGAVLGPTVPLRSRVASLALAILGAWALIDGMPYGRRHQGDFFMAGMVLINVVAWSAMLGVLAWNRRAPGRGSNVLWHAVAFAWLGFAAFPWMGELP